MLALLFLWLSQDISLALEGTLLKWQSGLRHASFLKRIHKPTYDLNDFVFIDVADDKAIAFDSSSLSSIVITDRKQLNSSLSAIAHQGDYRFVLCDLYFDIETPDDTALQQTIASMPRIGFPVEMNDAHTLNSILTNLPGGYTSYSYIANINRVSDNFFKFNLTRTGWEKSLPSFMAEQTDSLYLTRRGDLLKFKNKSPYFLNGITVDAQVRMSDLMRSDNVKAFYSLTDFIALTTAQDSAANKAMLAKKIIVIGDFSSDIHKTSIGDMPGAIIVLNIFLSLVDGRNSITIIWLLYLISFFTIVSHFKFFGRETKTQKLINRIKQISQRWIFGDFVSDLFINTIILLIGSSISYFIFNKTIEIIALAFWLTLLDLVRAENARFQEWRASQTTKDAVFKKYLRELIMHKS